MIRNLVLLLNLLGALIISSIFDGGVALKIDVPKEVVAGTDLRVQVSLSKGNLESFSRFQAELPAGLSASSDNSAFADFSFSEKKVRLMWLRLPAQNEITFSFTIHIDERLKGNFTLGGKFSYIEDNQRKSIDIENVAINITPSPTIDPSLVIDIKDFEKFTIPNLSDKTYKGIACIRQKPIKSSPSGDIIVNMLVCKPINEKYAKIEEKIPTGYTASLIEGKDAIFSSSDSTVKFLWVTPPAENYFIISYKLTPLPSTNTDSLSISGLYSYIEEDRTYNLDVVEQPINLRTLKKEDIGLLVNKVNKTVKENKQKILANNSTINSTPIKKEIVSNDHDKINVRFPVEMNTIDVLKPDTGIYYRIQLAAGHKPVNIKRYFRKFKLQEQVLAEVHDGWKKYSIGSFRLYRDARDYRIHIWNTTAITDAFVSAYNNGSRITVQEALMVGNQKWYK